MKVEGYLLIYQLYKGFCYCCLKNEDPKICSRLKQNLCSEYFKYNYDKGL